MSVRRRRGALGLAAVVLCLALVALVSLAEHGHASLPTAYGGALRLPSMRPLATLDPTTAGTPLEATLCAAVFDGLYRIDSSGRTRPVLAAEAPERASGLVTIALRPSLRRQDGGSLGAAEVLASLGRATHAPRAAWLLTSFARRPDGSLDGRVVDSRHLELRVGPDDVDPALVLSAAPLAIAVADGRRQPVGTGAFSVRSTPQELVLRAFARAAEGAPYLAQIRVQAPRTREEELRAFELGQLDASWLGTSVYGGTPVRPARSTPTPATASVLLVPNRARGPLQDAGLWGLVARAIDRRRLERVGLVASDTLAPALPPPEVPAARSAAQGRPSLRMPIPVGDGLAERLAEALAGVLDERGVALRVEPLALDRYQSAIGSGAWDLRVETVVGPLPGAGAITGAALAAVGQGTAAAALVRAGGLVDAAQAASGARALAAIVLGRRRETLYHRADLAGVGFDPLGRLWLADMHYARPAVRLTP